jgi:hypothetical protein
MVGDGSEGSLEEYLLSGKVGDERDIVEIERLLEEVTKVYLTKFDDRNAWPYEVGPNAAPQQAGLSQSTTAMILGALLRLAGYYAPPLDEQRDAVSRAHRFPLVFLDKALEGKIEAVLQQASKLLSNKVFRGKKLQTRSGSFGDDDIFTLAWLAEVAAAKWEALDEPQDARWAEIAEKVRAKTKSKLKKWKARSRGRNAPDGKNWTALFEPALQGGKKASPTGRPLAHAFQVLRAVQTIRRTDGADAGAMSAEFEFFEDLLHEQLSFSAIPDSRFDPAELVFCVEGMLLCQRNAVDRTLLDRVFTVLATAQRDSAFWRPVKPYVATKQGLVLFPVSVEVANSLLRSCQIFDGAEIHDAYGSKSIPLVRRYWQWLRVRSLRVPDQVRKRSKDEFVGWHSEHVNEPELIHLWETSQVMEFLMSYRNALHEHVARTTLVRSKFRVTDRPPRKQWERLVFEDEPVSSLGQQAMVYKKIDSDFVSMRRESAPRNYSMLLYGPPGTGKTTIAENIASALGTQLITLTVSDFLAGGGAQVEARAKHIFDVLTSQHSYVVLLDEIDKFLLDRDSRQYATQETAFQFMTPGMLTKLNDLRRRRGALFIIATNYEDLIDPAIKRPGRVDARFLVLPPDAKQRRRILKNLLMIKDPITKEPQLALGAMPNNDQWRDLVLASLYLGYPDMEAAVSAAQETGVGVDGLAAVLKSRARTISLEMYGARFGGVRDVKFDIYKTPVIEFVGLLAIGAELTAKVRPSEEPVVARVRELGKKLKVEWEDFLEDHFAGMNLLARKRVLAHLSPRA